MASKITWLIGGIIIGLLIIYLGTNFFANSQTENTNDDTTEDVPILGEDQLAEIEMPEDEEDHSEEIEMEDETPSNSGEELTPDVTFVMGGENFKFTMSGEDNPDLVVQQGDVVRIEFTSTSGFHDWVVDEFDAATAKVMSGNVTSVTFVADEVGTFEYYCSVGQHRANGMKGNLVVQ